MFTVESSTMYQLDELVVATRNRIPLTFRILREVSAWEMQRNDQKKRNQNPIFLLFALLASHIIVLHFERKTSHKIIVSFALQQQWVSERTNKSEGERVSEWIFLHL